MTDEPIANDIDDALAYELNRIFKRLGAVLDRLDELREAISQRPGPKGAAEECSTERSRAPDRQPVAPVEGRAWETPATRTV